MNENTPNTPQVNTPPAMAMEQATVDGGGFLNMDIGQMTSALNYFTLAWCIMYTFILVSDFFFWRVIYSNLEIPRLRRGEKSIFDAAKMWWTYLIPLFGYFLFTLLYGTGAGNVLGVFVIGGYIIKMIFDLPLIPVLNAVPAFIIKGFQTSAKAVTPEPLGKKEEEKKK